MTMATATKRATKRRRKALKAVRAQEKAIYRAKRRLERLWRRVPAEPVGEYAFHLGNGKTLTLAEAFGGKSDLVVVHNMGRRCPMCTTWADGFSGVAHHLEDRAALLVVSPDPAPIQARFARSRAWKFRMASAKGTTFFKDMGFEGDKGFPWPGISVFHREDDGHVVRVSSTFFGPGDEFSPVFGVLPMLEGGQGGWWPKLKYGKRSRRG